MHRADVALMSSMNSEARMRANILGGTRLLPAASFDDVLCGFLRVRRDAGVSTSWEPRNCDEQLSRAWTNTSSRLRRRKGGAVASLKASSFSGSWWNIQFAELSVESSIFIGIFEQLSFNLMEWKGWMSQIDRNMTRIFLHNWIKIVSKVLQVRSRD